MSFPAVILALASLASLASWIWLVTVAFQGGEKNWGIALIVSIFIPFAGPIVALVFVIKFWNLARKPALVFLGSLVLTGIGFLSLMSQLKTMAMELGENPNLQVTVRRTGATQDDQDESPVRVVVTREAPVEPVPSPAAEPPPAPRPTPPAPRPLKPTPPIAALDATVPAAPRSEPSPDNSISPLAIDVLQLGEANPNSMRTLQARARNTAQQPVREVRLALSYWDAHGLRLGRWTTVHSESTNVVPARTTNEFSLQAFFVPQFTKEVRVEVESIRFPDGDRWPPVDPTLARPDVRAP